MTPSGNLRNWRDRGCPQSRFSPMKPHTINSLNCNCLKYRSLHTGKQNTLLVNGFLIRKCAIHGTLPSPHLNNLTNFEGLKHFIVIIGQNEGEMVSLQVVYRYIRVYLSINDKDELRNVSLHPVLSLKVILIQQDSTVYIYE